MTRAQVSAEPISNRAAHRDDAVHVQTWEQITSIRAAGARAGAIPWLRRPAGVAPTSVPTRRFQRYFCRCTGKWLDWSHDCPNPPSAPLPSGVAVMPGTVLGPEWMTHRLVIDESIYLEGVLPVRDRAPAETSAVGQGGGDLSSHWFNPPPPPRRSIVGAKATVVRETSAVGGGMSGAGGVSTEGGAPKRKAKKRKNKGVAAPTAEEKGKGKSGNEGGGKGGGTGQVMTVI